MKNLIRIIFALSLLTPTKNFSQVVNDPNLQLDTVLFVQNFAVRVELNTIDSSLYYCTLNGEVYKILPKGSVPADSLVATFAEHGINHLTGFAMHDSTMYLSGTREITGLPGYGTIARAKLQSNNTYAWDTLMITETYENLGGTFDHSFGGLCLTPDADSIFIASGSRTDHGEVQDAGGMFPDTREVGLTSLILKIPVDTNNILIQNDSALIDASGFLFCRGVRNTFDIAYAPDGSLFGSENSGDRDDPDELNWLVQGGNYGFPWVMGNNYTGQQFPGYDYTQDHLLDTNVHSVTLGLFHDDPSYPAIPPGLTFREPVRNYGPDADIYRDSITGFPMDANLNFTYMSGITPHRSPLGLVFDTDSSLYGIYKKKGFMLSYTEGSLDSASFVPGSGLGPFLDLSEDLLMLDLTYVNGLDQYVMNCRKLVEGLQSPIDALLVGNDLYMMEISFGSFTPRLLRLHFPTGVSVNENNFSNTVQLYPNPAKENIMLQFENLKNEKGVYSITDATGRVILQKDFLISSGKNMLNVDISDLTAGIYLITLNTSDTTVAKKFVRN